MSEAKSYIRWDDPKAEFGAGPEEDKVIDDISKLINASQGRVNDAHHHAFTGTHVKTHGVVKGALEILPNLPPHLAQSMFASPNIHPIAIRYSTETTDLVPDNFPQPRGLAMKIFNVEGPKLQSDGQDSKTQDIEFNSAPAIELGQATVCRDIFSLRFKYTDPKKLDDALALRDDYEVQDSRNHIPNQPLYVQGQYSQAAFRYGDYIAKFAIFPSTESAQQKHNNERFTEKDDGATTLRQSLSDFISTNTAKFDLMVQLCQNLDEQPIEDARVEWDQSKYPFEKVASITISPQDSFTPRRINYWRDEIRLNPWQGLQSLQPLGSINRVRKGVYKASSDYRRVANGDILLSTCSKIDDIPDD